MRRSQADSTNRSLAAFGKLQHILTTASSKTIGRAPWSKTQPDRQVTFLTYWGVNALAESVINALAESVIGLFKTEVIRRKGPRRTLEAVEFTTLVWVDWFNLRRLLGPIGDIPPAEFEAQYYQQAEVA